MSHRLANFTWLRPAQFIFFNLDTSYLSNLAGLHIYMPALKAWQWRRFCFLLTQVRRLTSLTIACSKKCYVNHITICLQGNSGALCPALPPSLTSLTVSGHPEHADLVCPLQYILEHYPPRLLHLKHTGRYPSMPYFLHKSLILQA